MKVSHDAPPIRRATGGLPGGYTLVWIVVAWLAGIALYTASPLHALDALAWLALAALAAAVWIGGWAFGPPRAGTAQLLWRIATIGALLGCWLALGAARAAWTDPLRAPDSIARLANGDQWRLRGLVATEPDLRDGARLLQIDVSSASQDGGATWQAASGRVSAAYYGPDDWFAPAYGDTLALTGALERESGGHGAPAGVVARLVKSHGAVIARGGGNPALAWLFAARVALAQAIQRTLPEPEAALLIGILLGLKTPLLRARLALFTNTGTIHLVVPARLKVAVLAMLAASAGRRIGRWPRLALPLLVVAFYAALGGGGPAALRAAIMGAILVLAPAVGRVYNVFTSLALAALLMTLGEPLLIYDAGFQLTTLATLGLPLLVPPIQRPLARALRWLRVVPASGMVAELLAVTLAAQLATLPVLALTFHEVSFIAPIANLLTVPLLAPLLVLGTALALLATVGASFVAIALGWIVWPLLWYVDTAITLCANLPFAAAQVTDTPTLLPWVYYAILGAAVFGAPLIVRWRCIRRGTSLASIAPLQPKTASHRGHTSLGVRALVVVLLLALLGAAGASAPVWAARQTAHLDFLDVGQGGEAILLRLPSGATALINGGPSGATLEDALAGRLPFWQRSLTLALQTDPRQGDARGLADVVTHYTIAQAADAGMLYPSTDYLAWRDTLTRAQIPYSRVRQGNAIQLDAQTRLRVLGPPQQLYPPQNGATTASNNAILRLETPGLRALLLGSADAYALDALANSNAPLAADVVEFTLVPDAPLDLTGPLGDVLAAAHPRLIVISDAPVSPGSGAARAATARPITLTDDEAGAQLGALIYRTSDAGAIALSGGADG